MQDALTNVILGPKGLMYHVKTNCAIPYKCHVVIATHLRVIGCGHPSFDAKNRCQLVVQLIIKFTSLV